MHLVVLTLNLGTFICAGEVKTTITNDVLAMAESGQGASYEDFDYYPSVWEDIHNSRRRAVGWSLYNLVGIEKGIERAAQSKLCVIFFSLMRPWGYL